MDKLDKVIEFLGKSIIVLLFLFGIIFIVVLMVLFVYAVVSSTTNPCFWGC